LESENDKLKQRREELENLCSNLQEQVDDLSLRLKKKRVVKNKLN